MAALRLALAALLVLAAPVRAQTDAATQINLLAPQLQTFAGSSANFQALAIGLTQGSTVTLSTTTPDGFTQVVTFTPPAGMSAADAARALETARQLLISRAIVAPTAEQIAVTLMGGALPTALGPVPVAGVLTGTVGTNTVAVQRQFTGAATFAGSTANFQALSTGLRTGNAITLTSANGQTLTFSVPGGAMSDAAATQALQLAAQSLALQGIINPTPEQIRAALIGGVVVGVNGPVQIGGILQGRLANTSDSLTIRNTSDTPPQMSNTSASRITNTSATPPPAAASGASTAPGIVTPGAAAAAPGARLGAGR